MRILVVATFLLGTFSAASCAADFSVEDETLSPVPREVAKAVIDQSSEPVTDLEDKPCRFIGKRIDLIGNGSRNDWVLTTANACSWAASAAPIWVIARRETGYLVVLDFLAYDLTLGQSKSHGYRHIALMRATTARMEESLWKFDGGTYQLVRMRGH